MMIYLDNPLIMGYFKWNMGYKSDVNVIFLAIVMFYLLMIVTVILCYSLIVTLQNYDIRIDVLYSEMSREQWMHGSTPPGILCIIDHY